jgi:acetyl-CoA carboxylase carboxyltransferase component
MISLVLGPVVGVSALAASLADFTILGEEHGQLFLSSPLETPEVIDGEVDAAGLGGANLHASRSGIACMIAEDEEDACTWPPKFSHSCLTTTWLTRQLKKRLTRRTEKTPSSNPCAR